MFVTGKRWILDLEISEWGRFVIYQANILFPAGGGNSCTFSRKEPAIAWARDQATLFGMKWENFPDPDKKYPYDDRDGSMNSLTPVFVATWNGTGRAEVVRTEVCDKP
jgi:hypothetical protein